MFFDIRFIMADRSVLAARQLMKSTIKDSQTDPRLSFTDTYTVPYVFHAVPSTFQHFSLYGFLLFNTHEFSTVHKVYFESYIPDPDQVQLTVLHFRLNRTRKQERMFVLSFSDPNLLAKIA